ncbi:MAG TPA: hypothetical protein VK158_03815 [Acidobacteriota bacterium]|nr:hypothetical protein [Acidobacteriota bacterium]
MNHIFTISRLELGRRKRSARPAVILSLLAVLALFIGSFILLANTGVRNTHKFYQISASGKMLKYLEDSEFERSMQSNAIVIQTQNDSYRLATRGGFVSSALQASLMELITKKNAQFLAERNLTPLLYLQINSVPREEILVLSPKVEEQSEQSTQIEQPVVQKPLEQTDTNQQTQTSQTPTTTSIESDKTAPQISMESSTSEVVAAAQAPNIVPITAQSEQPPELITPNQLSTLSQIKDLFIVIQLMIICNFFSALFGNAIFEEKLNYKSSLLFVAPIKRREVIIGKLLPYFCGAILAASTVIYLQYPAQLLHPQTYVILVTLAMLYFAMSFLNGILSRSNKEYSFLNVFTTSILSLYLLIPSFLANYSTLGYASLFTPILLAIQGTMPQLQLLVFVVFTYLAVSITIFTIGSNLWDFERLYRYDSPFQKILYMLKASTKKLWHYFIFGVMSVPLIWIMQLVIIAVFLLIPMGAKLPIFLLLAALSEELIRNIIVKAHQLPTHEDPVHAKQPFRYAVAVGVGFAIAEKSILLIAIAPFLDGYKILISAGIIVPMILHTVFTYCAMKSAQRFPNAYIITCIILALIHATFNYAVLAIFKVPLI